MLQVQKELNILNAIPNRVQLGLHMTWVNVALLVVEERKKKDRFCANATGFGMTPCSGKLKNKLLYNSEHSSYD